MRVISLGAGVQSSTMALMVKHGELEADAAIFADTGWEPAGVYAWLERLEEELYPFPVYRVSAGDIRADALDPTTRRRASLPVFVDSGGPKEGRVRRQCTGHYKVEPVRRKIRELNGGTAPPVDLLLGISLDEVERMKEANVRWLRNVYPLIERRMSRNDCVIWLGRHDYPTPPKSACIGCPLHNDTGWRRIRENPAEWADAIAFDESIRHAYGSRGIDFPSFLHRSLKPLAMVDLSTPADGGQLDLLSEECEGFCGL